MTTPPSPLQLSLLSLRLGVFIVMAIWTVDKLLNPQHSAAVYEKFYFIGGLPSWLFSAIGIAEMVLLIAFLLGIARKLTYGIVLAMHSVSTLSAFAQYMNPFEGSNLLFFAAWPMLAACFSLFLLRDEDNFLSVPRTRA